MDLRQGQAHRLHDKRRHGHTSTPLFVHPSRRRSQGKRRRRGKRKKRKVLTYLMLPQDKPEKKKKKKAGADLFAALEDADAGTAAAPSGEDKEKKKV